MTLRGLLVIAASLAILAALFLGLPRTADPVALFSQFLGSAALVLMAWSQLMATRLPGVEAVFGGLDRVYVLHKWAGITAMGAILLHDTIDAEMDALGRQSVLNELGETLGELSLYGLLVLVALSVATFVPYHLWRWTHRIMGAFFAAGALHYVLELKPFAAFGDALGLYVSGFCGLGLVAYGYTLMPHTARRGRTYRVNARNGTGGATAIALTPAGRPIRHAPGQFAVLSFAAPGLAEPHPFSLSAPPRADGSLEVTVKPLGDFSHRLCRDLAPGTPVRVQGPFGRFLRHPGKGAEIWVAGGIGITPFVAWAEALNDRDSAPIHLFWAIRSRDEAPHLDRIEAVATTHPALTLHLCLSSEGDRLTAERIARTLDPSGARLWFCGPAGLRRDLQQGLTRHGLPKRRFHYEEFEFRTGVGLRRLATWTARRLLDRTGPA